MKGNKLFPQCGFSNTAVQILKSLTEQAGTDFETFDVLSDQTVREGVKALLEGQLLTLIGDRDTPAEGVEAEAELDASFVEALNEAISPESDLHASEAYRRHLASVVVARALAQAWRRSIDGDGCKPAYRSH